MAVLGSVGSGLNVDAIVSALVNAELAPRQSSLDRRESSFNAELSAVGTLQSALSDIQTRLDSLDVVTDFNQLVIDSPSAVTVEKTSSAIAGRYTIDVSKLASSQVLASSTFSDGTATIGTGTLTFEFGTPTYASGSSGAYSGFSPDATKTASVVIDSSNNTLAGIRDAVNAADIDVTASLVLDGTQTRLLFTSKDTGATNAMSITVSDGDGNNTNASGLSQLAHGYDSGTSTFTGNMTEAQVGIDAEFTLNGLSLTSASNTIAGLVDGLDFTLKETTTSAVEVVVSRDNDAIIEDVQSLVDSYNDYQSALDRLTAFSENGTSGALLGDSIARQLQQTLRSSLSDPVNISGSTYTTLSSLGITTDRDGQLSLNTDDLKSALVADADNVFKFFTGESGTTGFAERLDTSIDIYANVATGLFASREESLESQLDDIDDARLALDRRLLSLEERYLRQFTAMDTLVGQLQATNDFLSNQLKNLPGSSKA